MTKLPANQNVPATFGRMALDVVNGGRGLIHGDIAKRYSLARAAGLDKPFNARLDIRTSAVRVDAVIGEDHDPYGAFLAILVVALPAKRTQGNKGGGSFKGHVRHI